MSALTIPEVSGLYSQPVYLRSLLKRHWLPCTAWLTTDLPTGFGRVHLSVHWITLTGFVLAPPPVLGLRWRHLGLCGSIKNAAALRLLYQKRFELNHRDPETQRVWELFWFRITRVVLQKTRMCSAREHFWCKCPDFLLPVPVVISVKRKRL
jgi:hypothetical protein